MNKITTVCLGSLLAFSTLVAADFSKLSNAELQKAASTLQPMDVVDYRMEVSKRTDKMRVGEAREFHEGIRDAMRAKMDKMTKEEIRKNREAVEAAMRKQMDNMTVKEAREKGLMGPGMGGMMMGGGMMMDDMPCREGRGGGMMMGGGRGGMMMDDMSGREGKDGSMGASKGMKRDK